MVMPAAVGYIIDELLKQRPFVAFELVVADGRVVKVTSADQATIRRDDELLYVVQSHPPMTEIVATAHIAILRVPGRLGDDGQ